MHEPSDLRPRPTRVSGTPSPNPPAGDRAGMIGRHGARVRRQKRLLRQARRATREGGGPNRRELWSRANYDPLTGLPNRYLFLDRLTESLHRVNRTGEALALLFVDLDGFKEVNDSLGHTAGDQVLEEAARRIQSCIRESDTAGRLGGDEFAILISGLQDATGAGAVAEKVLQALAHPLHLQGRTATVSASVGITLAPADGTRLDDLLRQADQAMYAAKTGGKDRFAYFTPQLQAAALGRQRLTDELAQALERDELELFLQPIVDLTSSRTVKAEALLRWRHPRRGLLEPADFLSLAEDRGLMVGLGDWVLEEAVSLVRRWQDVRADPLPAIAINRSLAECLNPSALSTLAAQVRRSDLPAGSLILELPRGLDPESMGWLGEALGDLRSVGLEIALGDFDLDPSALPCLRSLPVDYIKVTRSLIHNLGQCAVDQAIVHAFIGMAGELGLRTIAIGVETTLERRLLLQAGCDYAQGYLFGAPIPANDMVPASFP